jgi:hypothetical protein
MSSFEGQSGYFCAAMGLIGAVVCFFAGTIGMTLFFHGRLQ